MKISVNQVHNVIYFKNMPTIRKHHPLGTQRCCDVESTSLMLIQRLNSVVCPVGKAATTTTTLYLHDLPCESP